MTTTAPLAEFQHEDGCHAPRLRPFTGKYGGPRVGCPVCKRSLPVDRETAARYETRANPGDVYGTINAHPVPLDWTDLIAKAERRGVPVMRVDEHGDPHLIRSVAQLRAEWED